MPTRLQRAGFVMAMALAAIAVAPSAGGAQGASAQTLLAKCTRVPDEQACRSVLRLRSLTANQRSLALTYLADSEGNSDTLLLEAVRLNPGNALAHYYLGVRYGQMSSASIRHLRIALSLRPDWTHIHRRLAQSYRGDTALRLWRTAASADPRSMDALAGLARALLDNADFRGAEAALRRSDSIEANISDVVFGLCETLLRQQKFDAAAEPCGRTVAGWDGDHGGDLRVIAYWAEEHRQYDLALAATLQGLREEPESRYFRSDRTRILYRMNRNDEANSLLLKYVDDHPQDWEAIEEAAELMEGSDSLRVAYELYGRLVRSKCAAQSGMVCSTKGGLAVVALRLDRVDEAFAWLDSALVTQSDCPELLRNFRRYASERRDSALVLGRLSRALDNFGAYITAKGDAGTAADFFATVERWDRAAEFYKVALDSAVAQEQRGTSGRFAYGLRWLYGRALVENGRYCEGLRELTAAQKENTIFMNGRPFLSSALELAQQRCRRP